jgi:hypothetical protein
MTKNQQILAKMGGGSLALLLSLSLGQQASAATLVSNLPPTTTSLPGATAVKLNQWVRSSFTTGSVSYGYTLNSVTLRFAQITSATPPDQLIVEIYKDNAGALGDLITSFTNPGSISFISNYIFTLTTPQTLAANTTFWLVARVSSGSEEYSWLRTDSTAQTGVAGWSIGDTSLFSDDQGFSWNIINEFNAFQFSVDGTVNTSPPPPTNIPEPGSVVALLGLGGLGLASRLKKLSTRA